jgi:tetratricopeptide (TPR) repeat protein
MKEELKALRSEQKKSMQSGDFQEDDFLREAAEGWEKVGLEKMDDLMARLDKRVDAKAEAVVQATEKKGIVRNLFSAWSLGIAASVMLVVLGVWYLSRPQAPGNIVADQQQVSEQAFAEALYDEYFKALDGPDPVFRGERDMTKAKQQAATIAYDAKDFDLAIRHYKELLAEKPKDPKYTLFLGLAYMSLGEYEAAITLYNSYVPGGVTYDEDIEWYLSLAHLKNGQINSARPILEKLAQSPNSYYKISASEIVARLP